MLDDVFDDERHRALARELLVSACGVFDIAVERVEFGQWRRELPYSWLCYLADPNSENLVGALTATSASDHLKRYDPGGILSHAGERIRVHVHELETSREAPFVLLGSEGEDVLISPWQQNLLVVRATFAFEVL